jgi:hypothetical protein
VITLMLQVPPRNARVIATESGADVACGVTVKPTLRVTLPELPLKVASVHAATWMVVTLKVLSTNPARIAVAGTFTTFGLILSATERFERARSNTKTASGVCAAVDYCNGREKRGRLIVPASLIEL